MVLRPTELGGARARQRILADLEFYFVRLPSKWNSGLGSSKGGSGDRDLCAKVFFFSTSVYIVILRVSVSCKLLLATVCVVINVKTEATMPTLSYRHQRKTVSLVRRLPLPGSTRGACLF